MILAEAPRNKARGTRDLRRRQTTLCRSPIGTCNPVTFVLASADADGLGHVVRACVEGRRRGEGGARIATFTVVRRRAGVTAAEDLLGIRNASRRRHDGVQAARRVRTDNASHRPPGSPRRQPATSPSTYSMTMNL